MKISKICILALILSLASLCIAASCVVIRMGSTSNTTEKTPPKK